MKALYELLVDIFRENVNKAVFSVKYSKDSEYEKCVMRNLGKSCQFEFFTKTQAFHENISLNECADKICAVLSEQFRQAEVFTDEYVYGIKISSKGKLLHNRRKNTVKMTEQTGHNREKKHIIEPDNAPQVLMDIGVLTKDGKIVNSKYDKYKQICRFLEFIDDVVKKDPREHYNIIDFGCGKSYLTFVCYHYMTKIAGKSVNIVGLDLKKKVIDDCNELCRKYGYDNLEFLCMDIKDYLPKVRPDMVIALHACDVATDYALYNAYRWQTDYIFSVPCCQHELNKKVKSDVCSILCDYGLIKERFSALATDALRGKMLEMCGYNVDVLEFIDIEHSPKNILIRASRTTRLSDKKRELIRKSIKSFEDEFNASLTLRNLVEAKNESFDEYQLICGKSSMLLKDAMTVRDKVFAKEQGYLTGSRRDSLDDTAWFANVYHNGVTVATSRMVYSDVNNERIVGKIAVLENYRKCGFGRKMLSALEKIALEEGANKLLVNAQKQAVPFYKKYGFENCGITYIEDNIQMIKMQKHI